jgi:hypothetical protein
MQSFGISKPALGGRLTWLTCASPFSTWGPEIEATRYSTTEDAWRIIGRLPHPEGGGASVCVLDGSVAWVD